MAPSISRLRPAKRGDVAAKDCRRSSNFAGLIFNIRKGEPHEGSQTSQPSACSPSALSAILPLTPDQVSAPFCSLSIRLSPKTLSLEHRRMHSYSAVPSRDPWPRWCRFLAKEQWNDLSFHFDAAPPREWEAKRWFLFAHVVRCERAFGPLFRVCHRNRESIVSARSGGYCGNAAADIEALSNVRAMYDFRD